MLLADSRNTKSTWLLRAMGGAWLTILFLLPPAVDFYPTVLFAGVVYWPITVLAVIFVVGVSLWLAWRVLHAIFLRKPSAFLLAISLLCFGVIAPLVGVTVGRYAAVAVLRDRIQDTIGKAKALSPEDPKIDATPFAAVYRTDGSVYNIQGLAYDSTGRLGEMLPKAPAERPLEWQVKMPESLQCGGQASHIWGNYWKVSLDLTPCISL